MPPKEYTDYMEYPDNLAAVLQALAARGFSVSSWAKHHKYPQQTVDSTLRRWANNRNGRPQGNVGMKIIISLRLELNMTVSPALPLGLIKKHLPNKKA